LSDALQRTIGLIASDVPYMLLENGRAGKAVRAMASFFQNILNEFKGSNLERTSAIEGNLLLLFTHFVREASKSRQIVIDRKTGEERLVIEFKNLVNKHYEEHRSIAFYAKSLGVTESRLSAACKKVLNRTPKSVCHQRLMLEAMRVLQYTSHSGAQIAYGLGFKDPAYFARFFKTQSGMTPGAYRGSLVGQR
jgi:AraC-like DNA-binding protein